MILVALIFVFGAWVVQQLPQLPSVTWLICAAFLAISLVALGLIPSFFRVFRQPKFLQVGLLSLAAFLVGFSWASSIACWRMQDDLPHAWEQKTIVIEGVVASVPELTERGARFKFDIEKIITQAAVVPRHISLNHYVVNPLYKQANEAVFEDAESDAAIFSPFHAGERWRLSVRLKRPHGTVNPHGFDFESWALSENIRATGSIKTKAEFKMLDNLVWRPSYIVEHLRELTQQRILRVLVDKPYSGVIQALVMGDDSQISTNDWQVFMRTGTSHLMSISGLHITMLAGLAFALVNCFWRRSPKLMMQLPARKAATLAGVLVALAYALIAGFSVPTQRTVYMLIVFAIALWTARQLVIAQVLSLALFVVVLIDSWAVNAPGFWLSFGAVALLAYVFNGRIGQVRWVKSALVTQWAVTIGMFPLLLIMFNQASLISPIANAFAIPLISFVVTPLALLGSFLSIDWLLHLSYWVLQACMWGLNSLNQLPIANWQQHSPAIWTLFPALLGVLWLLLPRGFPMRWLGVVGFLPMLVIGPALPASGEMKVAVLDVGQGLSVVVQTAKHTLLYDAGPKFNAQSDAGSRIVIPYLRGEGIGKLDGLMVSHNDIDHSGGMASVLAIMPVDWLNSSLPETIETPATLEKMQCYAGQSWLWDGVLFEVLHPSIESYDDLKLKDNNRSCVLKVTSEFGSLLLTGDIEKEAEYALLEADADGLKSDVLIVPHHGSKTSSTAEFIAAVAPSLSVFTSGYLNRYKHPKPEVLARYQAENSQRYRSDYQGALVMFFVKNNIQMVSWRRQYQRYWHDTFAAD